MPTGYTAKIADGISFREYAMDCARAFGACIMLRDEPGGGEAIPEKFEPDDYHFRRLAEAKTEHARLSALTEAEADAAAEVALNAAEASRLERLAECRELRKKYEAMIADVNAWNPPTDEHVNFRDFMREQIAESMLVDCGEKYWATPTAKIGGEEWRAAGLEKASRDIEYHAREAAKERERAASRTKWVADLRASLPA